MWLAPVGPRPGHGSDHSVVSLTRVSCGRASGGTLRKPQLLTCGMRCEPVAGPPFPDGRALALALALAPSVAPRPGRAPPLQVLRGQTPEACQRCSPGRQTVPRGPAPPQTQPRVVGPQPTPVRPSSHALQHQAHQAPVRRRTHGHTRPDKRPLFPLRQTPRGRQLCSAS